MAIKKNVLAAVSAAVHLYLEGEQQPPVVVDVPKPVVEAPRAPFSPWALSGRLSAMDMRRLWQMRLTR